MEYLSSDRTEICQMLLDNSADVNLVQSSEMTTNTMASKHLAELALDHGADIDATNKNGMSPLYLAILWGNRPLSKLLLRRGARKLKRTVAVRADVQVTTRSDSHAPMYTVSIWRSLKDSEERWRLSLSTQSFELSIDDEGYSGMVCEALGDDRASSMEEEPW